MQRFGLLLRPDAPGLARSERLQSRDPLPRRGFQPLAQGLRVVRHEFRPVPGAADLDVERLLVGEVGVVRLHGGDDGIDRPALEGVDGRGPCAVDVAKLGIGGRHVEDAPVLDAEGDAAAPDVRHLGALAVHETEVRIVAGPADFVALTQFHPLDLVDLDTSASCRETARLPADFPSMPAFQDDCAVRVVHSRHAQFIPFLDAQALVGAVEGDDVAG